MRLSELKQGMVVDVAIGYRYVLIGDRFVRGHGHNQVYLYNDDLSHHEIKEYDIVRVFEVQGHTSINDIFDNKNLKVLWEKQELHTLQECVDSGKRFKHKNQTLWSSSVFDVINTLDDELYCGDNSVGSRSETNQKMLGAINGKCWVIKHEED